MVPTLRFIAIAAAAGLTALAPGVTSQAHGQSQETSYSYGYAYCTEGGRSVHVYSNIISHPARAAMRRGLPIDVQWSNWLDAYSVRVAGMERYNCSHGVIDDRDRADLEQYRSQRMRSSRGAYAAGRPVIVHDVNTLSVPRFAYRP